MSSVRLPRKSRKIAVTSQVELPRRPQPSDEDGGFNTLLGQTRASFGRIDDKTPLFRTDATGLYDTFVNNLPEHLRGHYACRCCRNFVDRYGGLVYVDEKPVNLRDTGKLSSAVWGLGRYPEAFRASVEACRSAVEGANIIGVFLTSEGVLGNPQTGPWQHLALSIPVARRFVELKLNADQASAEKTQDLGTLQNGLSEFSLDTMQKAHTYLKSGQLSHSEKGEGVAKWLIDLHDMLRGTKNARVRAARLWVAVATAPAGFCHVKSGMIGSLLEDCQAGLSLEAIKARWDAKMDPLKYLRPQTAPSAQNLKKAEDIIAKLSAAGSLKRRYATLADLQDKIWEHKVKASALLPYSVFGHLATKQQAPTLIDLPEQVYTWIKFRDTVLPLADSIEYLIPGQAMPYTALVTAEDATSAPILQWDSEDARNPVSMYMYVNGSNPVAWGLQSGYVPVLAVTTYPAHWNGRKSPNHGERAIFILAGCKDQNKPGLGLFPEILRSELHEIRATIEAYSANGTITGREQQNLASGVTFPKGDFGQTGYRFRVTAKGVRSLYRLDRWD